MTWAHVKPLNLTAENSSAFMEDFLRSLRLRIIELEIKNWEKHNPRTDVKTTKWFKMSNEFFNDPEFYGMSLEGRAVWLFLLCTASKKMDGKIKINTQMVADNLRTGVDSVDFAVLELERCGSILVSPMTLLPNDFNTIESVRKSALEEKREEEKRREEKRKEVCSEPNKSASKPSTPKVVGPINEFKESPIVRNLLELVPQEPQLLWLQTYQDVPWITMEFTKIVNWLVVNPEKRPKSRLDRFINKWLSRGWESHRKTLPGQSFKQSHRTQGNISNAELEEARQLGII